MAQVPWQYPSCDFRAEKASEAIALIFNLHLMSHSKAAAAQIQSKKLPPIPRPKIEQDVSEEDCNSSSGAQA